MFLLHIVLDSKKKHRRLANLKAFIVRIICGSAVKITSPDFAASN